MSTQSHFNPTGESGGRVYLLFLLFLISLYSLYTAGITAMAAVCLLPAVAIFMYFTFKYKMFLFYLLMIVNYFLMYANRCGWLFLPISIHTELIELMLIAVALIDCKELKTGYMGNIMLAALLLWVAFCALEIFNDSCGLGINVGAWFTGIRLMAFQLLYAFIVVSLYINTPERVQHFIVVFALLSLYAVYWTWKQKTFGFNQPENVFLIVARRTHFVNGIIRYFSIFSDAATFGVNMASTAVAFIVMGITAKVKKYKLFFLATGLLCVWAFFASGTRTAIICFIAGIMVFIFLSKSTKIAIPVVIAFTFFVSFLMFTDIGNGNPMIRRMRSAFNKDDASMGVRDMNKAALKKYMVDAPWGIGIGLEAPDIPAYSKFKIVSQIPPDSEYVYIWVRTGKIGITVFVISTLMILLGAVWIILFRIKNPSMRGIASGFTCAFVSLHLGGYANQVLMQFPNIILFYGGMTIVYILPHIEKEYTEYENKLLAEQAERKRLKSEKKRASRV